MSFIAGILMSIAFAAFGALALYAGVPDLKRALAARRWPKTDGLIEAVSESSHRVRSKGRKRAGIEYHVRYHYVVAGTAYSGAWKSLISTSHRPGQCPFEKGALAKVFFNPANPGESRLFKSVTFQDLFLVLGGTTFVIAAVLVAFAPTYIESSR